MAYAQGDIILRDHYNTFATGNADGTANHAVANINTVWGTGNGDKGYGQSTVLTAVSAGDTVTATQWSTLIARLNSTLTHQSGSGSGITAPVSGDIIAYLSTLSGKVTDAYNNRLLFNSTRGTPATSAFAAGTWNSLTPTSFQQVRTVTFGSGDQARYFFNAGGRISLGWAVTNGTNNNKETAWTNLLGTKLLGLNFDQSTSGRTGTGGTLTTNGSSIGYWDLTTSDQTLIKLTDDTAAYTTNYVEVLVKSNGVQGSNADVGSVITFTINYVDNATDSTQDLGVPPVSNTLDAINMSIDCEVTITPPETSNLSVSWGTPSSAATVN